VYDDIRGNELNSQTHTHTTNIPEFFKNKKKEKENRKKNEVKKLKMKREKKFLRSWSSGCGRHQDAALSFLGRCGSADGSAAKSGGHR
jgi:RNA recognition motif-containing protein